MAATSAGTYKYTQPLYKYGYICNSARQFGDTNVAAHRAVRGAIDKQKG